MKTKCRIVSAEGVPSLGSSFAADVQTGLSGKAKSLPPKWFYDDKGSVLFSLICDQPEYYPTRTELGILTESASEILDVLPPRFQFIELGAGDCRKSRVLIKAALERGVCSHFCPIDISRGAIRDLVWRLKGDFAESSLHVSAVVADYFDGLSHLQKRKCQDPKVVMFLGSNIGNFDEGGDLSFLKRLGASLRPGDMALVGFDLIKDASILVPAYSDAAGVTRRFNENLLLRINCELRGDFCLDGFKHEARYNEPLHRMESHMVSLCDQEVFIGAIGSRIAFMKGESIHIECSVKYERTLINALAEQSGFAVTGWFTDENGWFADVVLCKK